MISLYTFENFLRFLLQDKHNASYFSNMSWRGTPQDKCKSNKKAAIITYLVVDLFACLNGIGAFTVSFPSLTFPLRYNGLSYALPQFLELLPEPFADGSHVNRKDELADVSIFTSLIISNNSF